MFSLGSWHGPACPREHLLALPSQSSGLQTGRHATESQEILSCKGLSRIIKVQLLDLPRTPQESHHVSENIVQTPPELSQDLCCANWKCILERKVVKSMGLSYTIFWNPEKRLQPIWRISHHLFTYQLFTCKRGLRMYFLSISSCKQEGHLICCHTVWRSSILYTTHFLLQLVDISAILSALCLIPHGPAFRNVSGLALVHSLYKSIS